MHDDIRIGTLVKADRAPANYIRQILPHGFESFELVFPLNVAELDLDQLAAEVRDVLERHGGGASISSLGVYGNAAPSMRKSLGRLPC